MQIIKDWNTFDFNNHIFFNCTNEINQIIKPLTTYFGLNSFVYHKSFFDGSEIRLSNQPQWIKHYLSNQLYTTSIFENSPDKYIKSRMLWSTIVSHSGILTEAKKFGIEHGITFVEPMKDGCEFYFIGTTNGNNQVINIYLTNLDLLDKFVQNFNHNARNLLTKAKNHKIIIPNKFCNTPNFSKMCPIQKANFLTEISGYDFTPREIDCILLLLQGKTAKMIALELSLSPRTVETYIEQLRAKTKTISKAELTDKLFKIYY